MTQPSDAGGLRLGPGVLPLIVAGDGLLWLGLGVGLSRAGMVSPLLGLIVVATSAVPAAAAVILGIRGVRREGGLPARIGLAIGGGQTLVLLAFGLPGARVPVINDVTTDVDAPPEIRIGAGADSPAYPRAFVSRQRSGYPDLTSLRVPWGADSTLVRARRVANELGWDSVVPTPDGFRAIDRTNVLRFTDDIAVRIRADTGGSVVDVRSRSRVGRSDLGVNARRIRRFLAAMAAAPAKGNP